MNRQAVKMTACFSVSDECSRDKDIAKNTFFAIIYIEISFEVWL